MLTPEKIVPLEETDQLALAIDLSNRVFSGRLDRSGQPAILHLLRVMLRSSDVEGRIVGVLHDVVEDSPKYGTPVTLDDLRAMGFDEKIVKAVDAVSRREGEVYSVFIERIITSGKLAIRVKLNDLDDNLKRVDQLPEGEGMRIRYEKARDRLLEVWGYNK